MPVLPATVTSGTLNNDNKSNTWVSMNGFQYINIRQYWTLDQAGVVDVDGYGLIKVALMVIDSDDWRTYVSNF